jgi:hypothetical protein
MGRSLRLAREVDRINLFDAPKVRRWALSPAWLYPIQPVAA